MNIGILFSTIEGHTGKICRFVTTMFEQDGHELRVFDTDAAVPVDLNGSDAVILRAPVHERRDPTSSRRPSPRWPKSSRRSRL